MDKQQIIDLMATRDYVLYADTGKPMIYFRNLTWTKLSAKVDLNSEEIQFIFLTSVGALLTVTSQWFNAEDGHTFKSNEATVIRAMISLGVER